MWVSEAFRALTSGTYSLYPRHETAWPSEAFLVAVCARRWLPSPEGPRSATSPKASGLYRAWASQGCKWTLPTAGAPLPFPSCASSGHFPGGASNSFSAWRGFKQLFYLWGLLTRCPYLQTDWLCPSTGGGGGQPRAASRDGARCPFPATLDLQRALSPGTWLRTVLGGPSTEAVHRYRCLLRLLGRSTWFAAAVPGARSTRNTLLTQVDRQELMEPGSRQRPPGLRRVPLGRWGLRCP